VSLHRQLCRSRCTISLCFNMLADRVSAGNQPLALGSRSRLGRLCGLRLSEGRPDRRGAFFHRPLARPDCAVPAGRSANYPCPHQ